MHLYLATRGQKHLVETLMNNLQGIGLPYKSTPHETPPSIVQVGVRPLQLWELAFPEEHLELMLTTLGGSEFRTDDNRWLPKFIGIFLKLKGILGLQDVPKYKECPHCKFKENKLRDIKCGKCEKAIPIKMFFLPNKEDSIDIKYIGIKKDAYGLVEMI